MSKNTVYDSVILRLIIFFGCSKGTKVEWRFTEQGEKVRVSKRTGHIIPVPISASETIDFKAKAGYPGKCPL